MMDKRTSEWGTAAGLMEAQNGSGPITGGYKRDSRCHVCSAPDHDIANGSAVRNLIDDLLLVPKSYAAILRLIEPLMDSWPEESRISRYGLMRHARNHLRWEQAAARRIAERNAERAGKVDDASERMLVSQAVLELIQQRGYEAIMSGEVTPSVRDTLTASSTLREIERETDGQRSIAEAFSQLDAVIQIIREEIPEDRWPHIVSRLEGRRSSPPPTTDPAWDELVEEMGDSAFK